MHVVPYDITYRIVEGKVVVHIFANSSKGRVVLIDDSFLPYFYARVEGKTLKKRIEDVDVDGIKVVRVEEVNRLILGVDTPCLKIYCQFPSDVFKIREAIKVACETYEFDVSFSSRYLVDNHIVMFNTYEVDGNLVESRYDCDCLKVNNFNLIKEGGSVDALAIDIETYFKPGQQVNMQEAPILMVGLHGKSISKIFTWHKIAGAHNVICEDEADMLTKVFEAIKNDESSFLVGYNSDGFDLTYLHERANLLKVKEVVGLDGSSFSFGRGSDRSVNVVGKTHIDMYKFIKRVYGAELKTDTYKLNDVANELLGATKDDVDVSRIGEAWDSKDAKMLAEFSKYNLKDCVLTYDLFNTILPNIEEMTRLVGIAPFSITRMGFSLIVEWFIIKRAVDANEMIMNKPSGEEIASRRGIRFQGAFVYEPTPGIYKDVLVYDFRSLYPTIITAHNLSPEAIRVGKKGYSHPENDQVWFSKDKIGFVSSTLEFILTSRFKLKDELKKKKSKFLSARVAALKLLANSFYGYLGFYGSRWYSIECADATTAFGRHYIHQVIERMEKEGYKILYGDTDSIFVSLEGKKPSDAKSVIKEINDSLPGLMELEFDGHYPSGIFVSGKGSDKGAKKRYCLLREDGTLKITGFEAVRRNVSFIAKDVQENVLSMILKDHAPQKALDYVHAVIDDLENGKIDVKKLVIRTKLTRDVDDYSNEGAHVKVARRLIERGQSVSVGSILGYVIEAGSGSMSDRARLPDEVKDIDVSYYIDNQILPVVESIFKVFGVDKSDLLKEGKQKGLGDFF